MPSSPQKRLSPKRKVTFTHSKNLIKGTRVKPEELTVVSYAGGQADYRLRITGETCVVETWWYNCDGDRIQGTDWVHDKPREQPFNTTAEAWEFVGKQLHFV